MLYHQSIHLHGSPHQSGTTWRKPAASASRGGPSRKDIIADICVVALWAASVPALMWVGAAAGF